jgi:hypothetical protein
MLVAGLRALGAGGVAVGGAGELVAVACQVCAQLVQGGGDPVEAGARAAGGMIASDGGESVLQLAAGRAERGGTVLGDRIR